jgi:hypothetical protein
MTEIQKVLDRAKLERLYGVIEIDFRNGEPTVVRVTTTKPLDIERENRHDNKSVR